MVYYSVVVKALESLTIVIVFTGGRPHQTATDHLRTGGLPRSSQPRLLDPAPGLPTSLLPAATDWWSAVSPCLYCTVSVLLSWNNLLNLALRGSVVLLGEVSYRAYYCALCHALLVLGSLYWSLLLKP